MRILLVEDDFLIGDGIKTGLEKLGFNIDWFQDGEDGEEALLQAPYDAVILDLGLPGKDGLLHISEIANRRFETMEQTGLKEGDMIEVKLIGLDPKNGKLKLSRKALLNGKKE